MEEVKIEKQDHYGRGIGKIDSKVVFVENALPEEVCRIELETVKKNFATGRITEILTSSKDRIVPFCPYYDFCGGCDLEHQTRVAELAFKKKKIEELLEKFANIKIEIKEVIAGKEKNYRNKVTLHGENRRIGYYEEKSHHLLPIEMCPLLKEDLNQMIGRLNCYLEKNDSEVIDTVVIRTTSKKEVLLSLTGKLDYEKVKKEFSDITSLYIKNQCVQGKATIEEEMNRFSFQISPKSFFQVNDEMREKLYQKVVRTLKDKKVEKLLDLYCGTGTMGILLSPFVKEVIGIDIEASAILDAQENARKNKVENATFYTDKVENRIATFTGIDCIIVDPPRAGLDAKTKGEIIKLQPKNIIYISCDPVTLSRDLKELLTFFELSEISIVDMFPNTAHVECVSLLVRKTPEK